MTDTNVDYILHLSSPIFVLVLVQKTSRVIPPSSVPFRPSYAEALCQWRIQGLTTGDDLASFGMMPPRSLVTRGTTVTSTRCKKERMSGTYSTAGTGGGVK